jgi:hypothetical protein
MAYFSQSTNWRVKVLVLGAFTSFSSMGLQAQEAHSQQCESKKGQTAVRPFPAQVYDITGQAWVSVAPRKKQKAKEPVVAREVVAGDALPVGATVVTGPNSYLSMVLMDCSKVVLPSMSEVVLQEVVGGHVHLVLKGSHKNRSSTRYHYIARLELKKGESEVYVSPQSKAGLQQKSVSKTDWKNKFEVKVPGTLLGVRGTHFRVKWNASKDLLDGPSGRLEVVEGLVNSEKLAASGRAVGGMKNARFLGAGMGSVLGTGQRLTPMTLLAAPEVNTEPDLAIVQVRPLESATSYKVQIAKDESFLAILDQVVSSTPRIGMPRLSQGTYFLRVTAIGDSGLEGMPRDVAWRVEPKPVAVVPKAAPRATGVRWLSDGRVEITWPEFDDKGLTGQKMYQFEMALDPQFNTIVARREPIVGAGVTVEHLPGGQYFWRAKYLNSPLGEPSLTSYSGVVNVP